MDEELWALRYKLRRELIEFARRRLLIQNQRLTQGEFIVFDRFLNPDALTIGFARRFATYKRAPLIFQQFENIVRLAHDKQRPRLRTNEVQVLLQPQNMGKGAALRTGFAAATGDIVAIQDADLEYDPQDLPGVIQPIVDGIADVTFGSRFIGTPRRALFFWHQMLNNALTLLSNMFNDLNITDMETCYKAFRSEVIKAITVEENRFGIEPELTAKVAKMRLRIYEVPVSYHGRTYDEGKKIGWKDGVRALYCIVKYGIRRGPR